MWLSRVKYGEYAAEFLWRYSTLKNMKKIWNRICPTLEHFQKDGVGFDRIWELLKKQYLTLLRAQFSSRLECSCQIETPLADFECYLTSPLESPCPYYCDTSAKCKDCRNDASTDASTFNPTQSITKGGFGRKRGHDSKKAATKMRIF